jgi:hypothetical protein
MSKKATLATALQTFDRAPETSPAMAARQEHQRRGAGEERAISTQAPSRAGKKALIGYFDPGVSKQLKQMALDRDGSVQDLLKEALNDLFRKHKKPTIA